MAAAAQAVAAPAPAPAPQNDAAEHAALVAELDAEDGGDEAAPAPKPSGKKGAAKPEAEVDADATEDEADEVTDDDAETEEDEGETAEAFETVDELREHLKSLAASGDVRKIEESLGLEAGTLKVNGAKLRYVNGQVEKATKATHEAAVTKANAEQLRDAAKDFYGPYVQSKQLYQTKEPANVMRAVRAMEAHFGEPLTAIVEAAIKASKGEAGQPNQQTNSEVAELRQQVQTLLQRTQQQQTAAQVQEAQARHLGAIAPKLKGTDLAKLKDAPKLVYDRLIGSFDKQLGGYNLNLAGAIKATLDDPATKWRLHELKSGRGNPAVTSNGKVTAPAVSPQRKRVVVAKVAQTPQQAEEAERAQLIAELEAEERRAERAARRK